MCDRLRPLLNVDAKAWLRARLDEILKTPTPDMPGKVLELRNDIDREPPTHD